MVAGGFQKLDSAPQAANHSLHRIMNSTLRSWLWLALATVAPSLNWAMDIEWTRMAGQWPVEASSLVGKFSESGQQEILVLNRGGQLLLWSPDGQALGAGQDGAVAQLPQGQWTTAPTLLLSPAPARFFLASVEGLAVGLDAKFQLLWQHKLPGQTVWGRALPATVRTASGPLLVCNDLSGTATCLTPAGQVAWTNALGAGPCQAPPQIHSLRPGLDLALIPAGSTLFCCDAAGSIRWRSELGGEIVTRPEVLPLRNRELILCGTSTGALVALDAAGKIVWQCATEDTFSNWLTFLPRRGAPPLILFTGLWGNLHAVDTEGRRVWTHLFRAKNRAAPFVLDADRDGRLEIFVPTFHQHVYEFDEDGRLKDDIRLSGIIPSAITPITDAATGGRDLLVTTTSLLAYRLRPGPPKSPYGTTPEPRGVRLQPPVAGDSSAPPALRVDNPGGALLNVQVSLTDTQGWPRIIGQLTSRSAFEMPMPGFTTNDGWSLRAIASDAAGKVLQEESWKLPLPAPPQVQAPPSYALRAWATAPYGAFSDTRLVPFASETASGETNSVSVESLYLDEADQAAFIVASTRAAPTRARVVLSRLARQDGVAFGGSVTLREVVLTGSVNGERVPDALPALGDAGLLTIPPQRAAKVWLSVNARGAQPGGYTGMVSVASLKADVKPVELPVKLEVLNLRLPREFPLRLCTWDYVPNRWFPSRSKEVLDDMSRHGVNVFPRSTIPPGRVDAAGKLAIDWTVLNAELDRLQGRGKILFHLNHPPIEFAAKTTEDEKRPFELDYIRALRDHLRDRGWGYADYAFYLLDEPGLDYGPNVAILLDAGKLFREADPKLLTYTDPVPGLSWKDYERIEPLVDVWAPNMRLVSGLLSGDPRMARIMKQKTVWSYECVSQVKSLSPLRYNRANAWRAKFFGLSGIGFWTHSTTQVDPWQSATSKDDEYALVYPADLPVPSVRWEAVRDGLEDVAAMALLEEQVRRHRQAGTKSELVHQAEETLRVALRDVMELSDEAFVESRDFLRAGDRVLGHTWTDVEMFRRYRAEIARLTLSLTVE
jgi:hypothetical protein